jgi:NosR/NirI family nitrous oxide reductase transcriptional regulator
MPGRFRNKFLLRLYRAGVLAALAALIHQQAQWLAEQEPPAVSLRQAGRFFPEARRITEPDPQRGVHVVSDSLDDTLGGLMTTAPWTDHIVGYSGPNNLLIALDPDGVILRVEMLSSGDTREHADMIRNSPDFLPGLVGWDPSEDPAPPVEAVSGATLTSFAVLESVQQRLTGVNPSLRFPDPVTLDEIRILFPAADHLEREADRLIVVDPSGSILGFAIRSSPQADNVSGYQGPTECLVAFGPDGRASIGSLIRKTYDTPSYVDKVREAESVKRLFEGRTMTELAELEYPAKLEGVSRSTMTAQAVVEGVQRRFAVEMKTDSPTATWKPKTRDIGLACVIAASLVIAFTRLRGRRWARIVWQLTLVGYVGAINKDLLSLSLLGGWAANGAVLNAAPGLALLAAAALLVPWGTRRNVYCHQICPHGAAQQFLGAAFKRRRLRLPAEVQRWLERIPVALLAIAAVALLTGWTLNLSAIEAFDAWNWKTAGMATTAIAIIGLVASMFVPMAYCRFGCPTGVLFSFVRSTGSADRWGRRDTTALALLALGFTATFAVRALPREAPALEPVLLSGHTMGTTWSVKVRDEIASAPTLEKVIAMEFEWAESLTSHWRTNTDLSAFNHARTTNAMEVPWPVMTLSRWSAEIHDETKGAFDITVGPLVRLWGFGPNAAPRTIPDNATIDAIRQRVGMDKLELSDDGLRKRHPELEVDLSSIAKGWAINKVVDKLEFQGYTNFLVEAGGELRAVGRWKIAIEHPTRVIALKDESIATSGTYRQNYKVGAERITHLIDPRTGRPITHSTVSVSVRHKDCGRADAWATALNVMGAKEGLPVANRLKLAVQFVIENDTGSVTVISSPAWKERETKAVPDP